MLISEISISCGNSANLSTSQNSYNLFPLTKSDCNLSSFSILDKLFSPLSSNFKQVITWKFEKEFLYQVSTNIYGSINLILFLFKSNSLSDFNFSKKSTFVISLFEIFRILSSFKGEYYNPYRSCKLL